MTDLSVIVVTHNGRDMARATLESAHANLGGVSAEFLVVDSGSTDGTPDHIARSFPDVRLWRRENIGFAAANNVALAHARGRYCLLLNPDVDIREGTLAGLVKSMDDRPSVGLSSVIQMLPDGRVHETIRRFPGPATKLGEAIGAARIPFARRLSELETRPAEYQRERGADWVVGAFMMARREAIEAVGPMDERFFLYSEETDWCRRFHDAGWEVRHLPIMRVVHYGASRSRPELDAQLSHAKLLYASKHLSRPKRELVRLALLLRHGLRLAALTPLALARPALRRRLRGETFAFAVCAGMRRPPFERRPTGAQELQA